MAVRYLHFCLPFVLLCVTRAQFHRKCPELIQPKFVPANCDWELITVSNCKWFNLTCSPNADVTCFEPNKASACNNASSFVFNKYSGKCELADNARSSAECIANSSRTSGFVSVEDCEQKCGPPSVLPFATTRDKWGKITSNSDDLASTKISTLTSLEVEAASTTATSRAPTSVALVHSVDKLELCRQRLNSSSDCKPEKRFFFNRTNGSCQESIENICPNEHNFATMDECQATCSNIEPCPVYELPPKRQNCRVIFIDGDDYCPEPEEECDATTTEKPLTPEEEKLKKCRSYIPKEDAECASRSATVYYYDLTRAVCVKKIVCSKADDLFKTKEECNKICSSVPPCPIYAAPIVGPGCRIEPGGVDRNFCPSPPVVICIAAIDG
uniref:BPTI/Kunitz inhibitor domain-containing protein n=1 Tax=Plectus sambesii TaxID=2011161 RepID=A0A914WE66_9BILA